MTDHNSSSPADSSTANSRIASVTNRFSPRGAIRRLQPARMGISVRRAALLTVILTILFPYIRLLPLSTDVQPNFLLAITFFGPFLLTIRPGELLALIGILSILLLYTIANPVVESFRAWPAYLTPPIVLMFVRTLLSRSGSTRMLDTVMRRSFFVWVGFGVLQFLTHSTLLELTFRSSTTANRGWMSFSGEPSAYGAILFLFAAYFMVRKSYRSAGIALLTVVVVAQSAVGLVYFAILAAAWFAVRIHKHIPLVVCLAALVAIFAVTVDPQTLVDHLPKGRRLTYLIEVALAPDARLNDASVNSRTSDLVLAYNTLVHYSPLGYGIGGDVRLKSGWGAYVYELGWIGFLLALGWILFFLYQAARASRDVFAATVAIIAMLFSTTPLSMPTASFIIMILILSPTDGTAAHRFQLKNKPTQG